MVVSQLQARSRETVEYKGMPTARAEFAIASEKPA